VLISSFRLHPLADLTRLWEALHGGKVTYSSVKLLMEQIASVLFLAFRATLCAHTADKMATPATKIS
jgi:hypothetical protein